MSPPSVDGSKVRDSRETEAGHYRRTSTRGGGGVQPGRVGGRGWIPGDSRADAVPVTVPSRLALPGCGTGPAVCPAHGPEPLGGGEQRALCLPEADGSDPRAPL